MWWNKKIRAVKDQEKSAQRKAAAELDAAEKRADALEREHWGFVHEVLRDITTAFERAAGTDQQSALKEMRGEIEDSLLSMIRRPSLWNENLRFITTMRSLVSGDEKTLKDFDDCWSFYVAFSMKLNQMFDVVEYYAESGELLEVLRTMKEGTEPGNNSVSFQGFMVQTVPSDMVSRQQHRLNRLYEFDRSNAAAKDQKTGDDDNTMELPLEMRLHLSGFYEKVTQEETLWNTRNILDSF